MPGVGLAARAVRIVHRAGVTRSGVPVLVDEGGDAARVGDPGDLDLPSLARARQADVPHVEDPLQEALADLHVADVGELQVARVLGEDPPAERDAPLGDDQSRPQAADLPGNEHEQPQAPQRHERTGRQEDERPVAAHGRMIAEEDLFGHREGNRGERIRTSDLLVPNQAL